MARRQGKRIPTFSTHFKLNRPQESLDFVDVPLTTDGRLFLDPYAFKLANSEIAIDCNNLLVSFFQTLLDAIRRGEEDRANELVAPLREPNEFRLGFSKRAWSGRGMGETHNRDLIHRLSKSTAARTGLLRDLCDCELLIPKVSSDRISDITGNVVRHRLADYTEEVCTRLGVAVFERPIMGWSTEHSFWESRFAKLPVYRGYPIVLTPKWAVRRQMTYDSVDYWRNYCLTYLVSEHLNAGTSLVRTLKNGSRIVRKKDLERELPCDKEALAVFSEQHPTVLRGFRAAAPRVRRELDDVDITNAIVDGIKQHGTPESTVAVIIAKEVKMKVTNNTVNGNAAGVVFGRGTVNARDIKQFRDRIGSSISDVGVRDALAQARELIETTGLEEAVRTNAADQLGVLTRELETTAPKLGVVQRCLKFFREYAEPVYKAILGAKAISDMCEGQVTSP